MSDPAPRLPIRRFDVFAEFNHQRNLAEGLPEDLARGNAIWLAKIVAGRRGMPARHEPAERSGSGRASTHAETAPEERFKSVGGEVQTDATFKREIVDRMGAEFYEQVFAPAIAAAVQSGQRYEDIRDAIRADWKPRK